MVKSLGNSYFVHKTTLFCRSFQTATLNRWSAAEETVGLRTKYHIANTNKASIEMDCGQIRTDFLVHIRFPIFVSAHSGVHNTADNDNLFLQKRQYNKNRFDAKQEQCLLVVNVGEIWDTTAILFTGQSHWEHLTIREGSERFLLILHTRVFEFYGARASSYCLIVALLACTVAFSLSLHTIPVHLYVKVIGQKILQTNNAASQFICYQLKLFKLLLFPSAQAIKYSNIGGRYLCFAICLS